jgi:hypothetical protein
MQSATPNTLERLTADALQLAISLDSFATVAWVERIGPAVQQGSKRLKELERRQASLVVSRADEAVLGWVIEAIGARLTYLERLSSLRPAERRPRRLKRLRS